MSGIRIRPMTQNDVGEVLVVERAVFSLPWTEDSFRNYMDRPETAFFVTENGEGRIVGYAAALFAAEQGDVANVAVRPEYRRAGFGRALMEVLLEEADKRGAKEMFLEVREGNVAARTLYEAFGFAPVGRRKNYYHEPTEDAVIMRREGGTVKC